MPFKKGEKMITTRSVHLEEAGCLKCFLNVVLGDQHSAGVGVIQKNSHGFCIHTMDEDSVFMLLFQIIAEHCPENPG